MDNESKTVYIVILLAIAVLAGIVSVALRRLRSADLSAQQLKKRTTLLTAAALALLAALVAMTILVIRRFGQ